MYACVCVCVIKCISIPKVDHIFGSLLKKNRFQYAWVIHKAVTCLVLYKLNVVKYLLRQLWKLERSFYRDYNQVKCLFFSNSF